jgi:hypothetical protein
MLGEKEQRIHKKEVKYKEKQNGSTRVEETKTAKGITGGIGVKMKESER